MKHFLEPDFCPSPECTTPVSRTDVRAYDISELYQFADQTGILERHRQMLSQPFQDSQVHPLLRLMSVENISEFSLRLGSIKSTSEGVVKRLQDSLMVHSKILKIFVADSKPCQNAL